MTGFCVRPKCASGVRLDLGQWITPVVGEEIVLQEVGRHDRRAKPGFTLPGMRIDIRRRLFARMTGRTTLCENFLAPCHRCRIGRDVSLAPGSVGEMKRFQATEECRNVPQALFSCAPEDRMFPRLRNPKRFL